MLVIGLVVLAPDTLETVREKAMTLFTYSRLPDGVLDAGLTIILVGLLLLEVWPRQPRSVLVQDSNTELAVASIRQRVTTRLEALNALPTVEVKVTGRRKGVYVRLRLLDSADVNMPELAERIKREVQDEVEVKLGVRLLRQRCVIIHAPSNIGFGYGAPSGYAVKLRQPVRIVLSYLRAHKSRLFSALFWRSLYVLIPMQIPVLTGAIVDGLTGKRVSIYGWPLADGSPVGVLRLAVLGLVAVAVAHGLCAYARLMSGARLSRHFVAELRKAVFHKLTYLSLDLHQMYGAGELLDRAVSDTGAMRRFIERVYIQTITNVLRVGYPIVMLFAIDAVLALVSLSILPLQWLTTRYLQNKLHAATRKRRETRSDLITAVKENLDGIETIKTLNAEGVSVAGMTETAEQLEDDELYSNRLSAVISGIVWLATSIGIALTWWLGGRRVISDEMTVGTLIAFAGFATFAYRPFRQFATIVSTYRQGIVSLERIQDLLDIPSSIREHRDARLFHITEGRIEFQDVSFAYKEQPILKQVNLTIEPRRFTALVGRSGSGKSSLLRLVARLYDTDDGQVLIDGQALEHIKLDSLRSQIAIVPQHPVLFSGTVFDNICLARPDASQERVRAVCQAASALSFIEHLEAGFETHVGRGGVSLSGGEMQRIAIARALLNGPKILLMDEPTSALDAESESAIVATLLRLRQEMTVVLVGHRLKTVCQADRIFVMDEGQVVAEGTHDTLLAQSKLYHELFATDELAYA